MYTLPRISFSSKNVCVRNKLIYVELLDGIKIGKHILCAFLFKNPALICN